MSPRLRSTLGVCAVAAVLCAGMAVFLSRVWIGRSGTDFYPRWFGGRALVTQLRNPYAADVTRDIQRNMYGKAREDLPPESRPDDEQRFAYPIYLCFPLAPLALLPFPVALALFRGTLIAGGIAAVALIARAVRTDVSASLVAVVAALNLFSLPSFTAIRLGQLAGWAALFASLALWSIMRGNYVAAGVLLALATIKPHIVLLLVPAMLVWSLGEWRVRRRFAITLIISMVVLIGVGWVLVPTWLANFFEGTRAYARYFPTTRLVDLLPWRLADLAAVAVASGALYAVWKYRKVPGDSAAFMALAMFVAGMGLLIVPAVVPQSQLVLTPAWALIVVLRREIWSAGRRARLAAAALALLVGAQWVSATSLAAISLLSYPTAVKYWVVPFALSPLIPLFVAAVCWEVVHSHDGTRPVRDV